MNICWDIVWLIRIIVGVLLVFRLIGRRPASSTSDITTDEVSPSANDDLTKIKGGGCGLGSQVA
ncbi:hypothetical protein ACFL17_09305 [Pseudomonadota bacterium]